MIVTSCSRFLVSGVPDTSESLGHLAESTLLSHDVVSDDLSWSTSDLITRLYLLVSIRHRQRCERAFLQDTKEALNSSCIFKVLRFAHSNHFFRRFLQISPQTSHRTFLFARFQTSPEPQRAAVSQSRRVKISPFQTGTPLTPLNQMTQMSLCHAAPLPCTTRTSDLTTTPQQCHNAGIRY